MKKVLPLADWLPDQPDFGNVGITAQNVIPWARGYKKFPSFSVYSSNALTARFQGGLFGRDSASNVYNFAGDATKLYRLSTAAWSDVTRSVGGAYTTAADDWWEFVQWGQTILAVNGHTDAPQTYTLNSSSNFAALSGSPPSARHIGVVRDFVVLGNVFSGGVAYPARVQWSGINNSGQWTPSQATQSDYQDLQGDTGWVQKVIGGEYGLIVCERAIFRMTYIGLPEIFRFDQIEIQRGAFAPQSVVVWGNRIYFLSDDGFYEVVGGSPAEPIGDGKVDRYFLDDLQSSTSNFARITGTIDPINKLVMWSYAGSGSSSGTPNKILIYNWVHKKWSIVNQEIEGFVRYAAEGYTLDTLDTLSTSLDALTSSLDSRVYTGGAMTLAAFNTSHKIGTFSGTAMAATVDTGEYELSPGRRSTVSMTRPLVDGNAASVAVRERLRLADSTTLGTASSQDSFGNCPVFSDSRYHAFRITTSGNFNFIQGVEAEFSPTSEW